MMPDRSVPEPRGGLWLGDDELERLQELVWAGYPFAYVLYVQELRRHMDVRTGVVGDRRRVSEQGMAETLERAAKRGPDGAPKRRGRDFIQRQIKALIKLGLVERLPKGGQFSAMRFLLPLAVPGLIRPQEMRTVMHTVKRTEAGQKKSTVTDASDLFRANAAQQYARKCAHHQDKDLEEEKGASGLSFDQLAAVDMEMVVKLYHEILVAKGFPKVRAWSSAGYRHLVARTWYLQEDGRCGTEAFWRRYFMLVAGSEFLTGRLELKGGRRFQANFKYVVNPATVVKVLNGEYT